MKYPLLLDIIYILAISAVALFLCNRIRIPAIVGFLLVGILVGPAGLHVVHSVHAVDQMAEIGVVLRSSNAVGHSLAELNLRKEYGITVLAINREGSKITLPDGDERFAEGDTVVMLGLPELLLFADNILNPH